MNEPSCSVGMLTHSDTVDMRIGSESMNLACAGVLANLKRAGEYLEGFVEGWKELIILLELHKRTTTSTFGTRDSRGPFHQSDFGFDGTRTVTLGKVKSPRLLWQSTANPMVPFDGVPFLICGRKVLECQYGPKRDARRRKPEEKTCEDYCKQIGTRISRKRGCPATITVRRIVRFPDHALYPEDMAKGKSDWAIREKKADILFRLKTRLRNGQVQGKERFYVQLPCDEAHLLHPTSGEEACMSQKLHPAIIDKIYELVNSGLQDVNQIKENLHSFVEREFSLGASKEELSAILDQNNRAYYPTSHDIRNHMYHANQQLQKKRRPTSQGVDVEYPKKRRALVSSGANTQAFTTTTPVPATQADFNDIFRKGLDPALSPSTLINSRPYGIAPPKMETKPFSYSTAATNPLEQAGIESGLILDQSRLKPEPMYLENNFACSQLSVQCSVNSDSAFKTYHQEPSIMPTIGTVIGGASHLADYGALEYAQAYNPVTAGYNPDTSYYTGNYLDETSSYLNTLNNTTNNYMNSPTLSHVTTEPIQTFITDPFSSCAKSGMGSPASYYSKTLGPCTEVIKASMDLI